MKLRQNPLPFGVEDAQGQWRRTPVRQVQVLAVGRNLQVHMRQLGIDGFRERTIGEGGAVSGQTGPLVEVERFLPGIGTICNFLSVSRRLLPTSFIFITNLSAGVRGYKSRPSQYSTQESSMTSAVPWLISCREPDCRSRTTVAIM